MKTNCGEENQSQVIANNDFPVFLQTPQQILAGGICLTTIAAIALLIREIRYLVKTCKSAS